MKRSAKLKRKPWPKAKKPGSNKYGARSTVYQGRCYHSAKEARYAAKLDLLIKKGEVSRWKPQKRLELRCNGHHITNYYIDFLVWLADGSAEFVEVKGFPTAEWRLKWALTQATFEQLADIHFPDAKVVRLRLVQESEKVTQAIHR